MPARKAANRTRSNKITPALVADYAALCSDHPTWTLNEVAAELVRKHPRLTHKPGCAPGTGCGGCQTYTHKDVGRLRMLAGAPEPYAAAFANWWANRSGGVGPAQLDRILQRNNLSASERLVLLQRCINGEVGGGVEPLDHLIRVLPTIAGSARTRWLDAGTPMTAEDMHHAKLTSDAAHARATRRAHEEAKVREASVTIDHGVRTARWIADTHDEVIRNVAVIKGDVRAVLAVGFDAPANADLLEDAGAAMIELARLLLSGGRQPEERPGMTSYQVIDCNPISSAVQTES